MIWKKSIKTVKESKPSFFFTLRTMFYLPLSLFNYISLLNFFIPFSRILLFSLLNVFIPSSTIFIIFSPQCFLFPSATSTSTSSFLWVQWWWWRWWWWWWRENNRNEEVEVEVEVGNKKHWGEKIIKIVEEGIKTLRRENNKIVEKGI